MYLTFFFYFDIRTSHPPGKSVRFFFFFCQNDFNFVTSCNWEIISVCVLLASVCRGVTRRQKRQPLSTCCMSRQVNRCQFTFFTCLWMQGHAINRKRKHRHRENMSGVSHHSLRTLQCAFVCVCVPASNENCQVIQRSLFGPSLYVCVFFR